MEGLTAKAERSQSPLPASPGTSEVSPWNHREAKVTLWAQMACLAFPPGPAGRTEPGVCGCGQQEAGGQSRLARLFLLIRCLIAEACRCWAVIMIYSQAALRVYLLASPVALISARGSPAGSSTTPND